MTRRRKIALGAVLVAILGIGALKLTSPPLLLSVLDAAMGGGIGADKVGNGIAFGTHGQKLDVWRPATSTKTPMPVVIFWYGGGWVNGSRGDYAFAARAFAKRGFVVVMPDYRKVPRVRFPAFLQDGAEAVKWTRDNVRSLGGDPDRIALAGHSAGAYTAVMLTLDRRWLTAAGVEPGIVKAAIGLCGPYDFYPFTAKRAINAMQGAPDPQMTQPIHFARADAAPLLLISAGDDVQVRAHNANNLTARIEALGGTIQHIDYPGLSHENVVMALSRPFRGEATVLADSAAFLNRALVPGQPAALRSRQRP